MDIVPWQEILKESLQRVVSSLKCNFGYAIIDGPNKEGKKEPFEEKFKYQARHNENTKQSMIKKNSHQHWVSVCLPVAFQTLS